MKDYNYMMRQVTLRDQKKDEILELLENRCSQKRRRPVLGRLVVAAVLAAGCLLCIAAGLSNLAYRFSNGAAFTTADKDGEPHLYLGDEDYSPAEIRDGRLWFTAHGREIDITDLVDEETPYIYTHTDASTGEKGYVIVGGTLEDFGWAEYSVQGSLQFGVTSDNASEMMYHISGQGILESELTDAQWEQSHIPEYTDDGVLCGYRMNSDVVQEVTYAYRPWLASAMNQLGLRP